MNAAPGPELHATDGGQEEPGGRTLSGASAIPG